MIKQGNFGPWRKAAALFFAALLAASATLVYVADRDASRPATNRSHTTSPSRSLAALRMSADAGDARALAEFVEALGGSPASRETRAAVADMLRSDRPEVRAGACAWIGKYAAGDDALTPLVVPRLSDADWRVRAAAFDALPRIVPTEDPPSAPPPLRDTPVSQRETLLFAWIDSWRTSERPLPEHCELYAPAGGHWLAGLALARSCTSCHAPQTPYATESFVACATCHGAAHEEWSRSSHARSMTHVNLARVNERTKQVERFVPDQHEGLVCTSCHARDESPLSPSAPLPPPPGTRDLFVPHRFQPAAASCARCHPETQAEWQAWRTAPRPSVSRWLPGEITWDESPEQRTCVSCHMGERRAAGDAGAGGVGLVHLFAARRDPSLMRGGLSIHLEPPTSGRGARLVLTNLAGHRYPSGTIRRALRIELRYDTDPEGAKRLLTRLTDSSVPATQPTEAALAPGEQRRFDLPTVAGASRVTCEVTYERNQFEPGGYELPLHGVSERLTR